MNDTVVLYRACGAGWAEPRGEQIVYEHVSRDQVEAKRSVTRWLADHHEVDDRTITVVDVIKFTIETPEWFDGEIDGLDLIGALSTCMSTGRVIQQEVIE